MKFTFKPGWFLLSAIIFLLLQGCTKNITSSYSYPDTRIYIAQRDSTVQYNTFKTFSVSDSITIIDNGQTYKSLTTTGQAFIDAMIKYMKQNGYTLVSNTANPDLGVNLSYINTTSNSVIDMSSYLNYYGGYWDPSYWGYGGYGYYSPSYYGTYQINQASLSINILDLKDAVTNGNRIKIIWNGLIQGEGIDDATTADTQILHLFQASPYLKAN